MGIFGRSITNIAARKSIAGLRAESYLGKYVEGATGTMLREAAQQEQTVRNLAKLYNVLIRDLRRANVEEKGMFKMKLVEAARNARRLQQRSPALTSRLRQLASNPAKHAAQAINLIKLINNDTRKLILGQNNLYKQCVTVLSQSKKQMNVAKATLGRY